MSIIKTKGELVIIVQFTTEKDPDNPVVRGYTANQKDLKGLSEGDLITSIQRIVANMLDSVNREV